MIFSHASSFVRVPSCGHWSHPSCQFCLFFRTRLFHESPRTFPAPVKVLVGSRVPVCLSVTPLTPHSSLFSFPLTFPLQRPVSSELEGGRTVAVPLASSTLVSGWP